MRRSYVYHALAAAGLALAVWFLFYQVLDTGFWSPEDLGELDHAARVHATGELNQKLRPALAGGYATNPVFGFEFQHFLLRARPYFLVNIFVHYVNSLLAYLLIVTLLHDRRSAFMAALLFALGVGSYGKNLMSAAGVSSLVYASTVLAGTLLYVLNEKRNAGKPLGLYALGFYTLFVGTLFMRGGTFSLLASFAFYNFFFARERGRPVLHTNLAVCLGFALGALFFHFVGGGGAPLPGPVDTGAFLRNLPRYLILMLFPLQQSELLSSASSLVKAAYAAAPYIRVFVGLSILSFSLFGFVFGSRALRFYIAWMYVMVLPFAFFRYPSDWLNLRFLYLVSIGFCVVLTTGTLYAFRLLSHHRLRRFVPFVIPAAYVVLSASLVRQLDRKNEQLAALPETSQRLARIAALLES